MRITNSVQGIATSLIQTSGVQSSGRVSATLKDKLDGPTINKQEWELDQ